MKRKSFLKTILGGAMGLKASAAGLFRASDANAQAAAGGADAQCLTEPARQTPVIGAYDVVVVGGGAAGIIAAMSAARSGARTLLIEQQGVLGGTILGGASVLNSFYNGYNRHPGVEKVMLVRGTALEMVKFMIAKGVCPGFDGVNIDTAHDGRRFLMLPEPWKTESLRLMKQYGVDVMIRTTFCDALTEGGRIRAVAVQTGAGRGVVLGRQFIDCSGDADLAASAGAEIIDEGGQDRPRETTLLFSLNHVDVQKIMHNAGKMGCLSDTAVNKSRQPFGDVTNLSIDLWKVPGIAEEAKKMHSVHMLHMIAAGEDTLYYVNLTRVFPKRLLDWRHALEVEMENRDQIEILLALIKKHIPGFERAYVSDTAAYLGVRRTRTVRCEYDIQHRDIIAERRFPDEVGLFGYQDQPSKGSDPQNGGAYGIPFRALRPTRVDNLLVAGRLITTNWQAHMSTRNTACCMLQGDAAGAAAALCAARGADPGKLDVALLQKTLRAKGTYLP